MSQIDVERVRRCDVLFLLVCAASFIESGSDTYARNLADLFADDAQISRWLREQWEREELQHGRALRAYIESVWPEFDWAQAYAAFFDEYSGLCTLDRLEATRGQEMAGRCIVEMGTTTYYQALHAVCPESVLRELTWRIRCDEVRHYKHFYAYFLKYRQRERLHRPQIFAAVYRRLLEIQRNDAGVALRHAAAWRFPGHRTPGSHADLMREAAGILRADYPMELAVHMTLKPLRLPPGLQRWAERPISILLRRTFLR